MTTAEEELGQCCPTVLYHGYPLQCSKGMGEQPAQYPAQEQHKNIIHGMFLVHTEYALSMYWYVLSMYQVLFKIISSAANLRVEGMEELLWQIEGIASCTHQTPEQLRLPFHTAKCSQSTFHCMLMKNMVELCRSPASSRFCPLIDFIWKS